MEVLILAAQPSYWPQLEILHGGLIAIETAPCVCRIRESGGLSSEEVKSEQIEDIPVQLIFEIPRTGSGKIIRYKLRKLIKGKSAGLAA